MASIIVTMQNKLRLSSGTVPPLTPHSPGSIAPHAGRAPHANTFIKDVRCVAGTRNSLTVSSALNVTVTSLPKTRRTRVRAMPPVSTRGVLSAGVITDNIPLAPVANTP